MVTGDIVDSRQLANAELDGVMDALAAAGETIRGWMSEQTLPLERFRGDGWQIALPEPRWALRACLELRAAVRSHLENADTRLAIGIGAGTLDKRLSSSHGDAFERSGTALAALKGRQRWTLTGGFEAMPARALARGLVTLCDAISQEWTARQAEAFALRAAPEAPTMAEIAQRLGVTQQTVQAHLARAYGDTLVDACEAFEQGWDTA